MPTVLHELYNQKDPKRASSKGPEISCALGYMVKATNFPLHFTYGGCSKIPLSANGHSSQIKKYCRESFANRTFVFRGGLMSKYVAKSFAKKKL